MVDYLGPVTANGNWAGYLFPHPLDNDNTDNTFRVNNTVKHTSNNYGGLTFGGLYGFSNATNFSANRLYSLGAQYTGGALTVAAAYLEANDPSATTGGALAGPITSTSADTNFAAARQRVWGAGINYTLGLATLGFMYTHTDLLSPTGDIFRQL